MKLAFFNHSLRLGSGVDTVIYELASRIAKKEEVAVMCFESNYDQKLCNFEIKTYNNNLTNSTNKMMTLAPLLINKLTSFEKEIKRYDVINTHHYPANYIMRKIKGPLNIVTEWSGANPSLFSSIKERLFLKWVLRANRISAVNADLVISPCEFVSNWIRDNYSIDPITMFLDGVNFDTFNRKKVMVDRAFDLYPDLEGKQIILYVGRITETKNVHWLIEIIHLLKKKTENIVLLLVGDYRTYPSYYSKLKDLVKSRNLEDNVIFTGIASWEDLPSYYAASHVYATCTQWEGFLRAEAFAFGKPIVCFDTGANSETVTDSYNGFLVKNGDLMIFAEKMFKLLSDSELNRELGENGYRWAKENLDFDIISENFRTLCIDRANRSI